MNTKILIVDDEPNILMALDFLFRKSGFHVFVARDGEEALALLQQEKPQVMLLDIMMPDIDGYQVCQYARRQEKLRDMKIVFLSAKSQTDDIKKGISLGADRYITKPFSTKALLKEVQELVSDVASC